MFSFLVNKKKELDKRKISYVYDIAELMRNLEYSKFYELRKGLYPYENSKPKKMLVWEIVMPLGGFKVDYFHNIRASLITIKKEGTELSFVDQTLQYDGMIGMNDLSCNMSKRRLANIIRELNKFISS